MNAQRRPAPKRIASSISLDRRDVVVHEPQRLAPQRLEQAVGDEAVDLVAQAQRAHADRRGRPRRALDRLGRRSRSPPQTSTSGSR